MSSRQGYFQEARILADFANVNDQQAADYFRNNHPGFVPMTWWIGKDSPDDLVWKEALAILQAAWQDGFSTESSVRLIALPTSSRIQATEQIIEAVPDNAETIPVGFELDLSKRMKVWPFQSAVMFLAMESWRARRCLWCNRRFVADIPSRKFCSDACFRESRKTDKREWWSEEGSQQRRDKRRKR